MKKILKKKQNLPRMAGNAIYLITTTNINQQSTVLKNRKIFKNRWRSDYQQYQNGNNNIK